MKRVGLHGSQPAGRDAVSPPRERRESMPQMGGAASAAVRTSVMALTAIPNENRQISIYGSHLHAQPPPRCLQHEEPHADDSQSQRASQESSRHRAEQER